MPAAAISVDLLLRSLPIFQGLGASAIARLAEAAQRRALHQGEHVFRCGSLPAGMYAVVHGQIKLMAPHGGRRRLVGVVGAGASFGEPVMFLNRPALVDAIAATDALVLLLPTHAVLDEIERNPAFARRVIVALSERAESLVLEIDRQAAGSGRSRLAHYLLQRCGEGTESSFVLPASKASLAAQLHLTPGHFSRLLRELSEAGLLRVERRRFTVTDRQQLARLTDAAAASPGGRTRAHSGRAQPPP